MQYVPVAPTHADTVELNIRRDGRRIIAFEKIEKLDATFPDSQTMSRVYSFDTSSNMLHKHYKAMRTNKEALYLYLMVQQRGVAN